jgi:hypothetical protein
VGGRVFRAREISSLKLLTHDQADEFIAREADEL